MYKYIFLSLSIILFAISINAQDLTQSKISLYLKSNLTITETINVTLDCVKAGQFNYLLKQGINEIKNFDPNLNISCKLIINPSEEISSKYNYVIGDDQGSSNGYIIGTPAKEFNNKNLWVEILPISNSSGSSSHSSTSVTNSTKTSNTTSLSNSSSNIKTSTTKVTTYVTSTITKTKTVTTQTYETQTMTKTKYVTVTETATRTKAIYTASLNSVVLAQNNTSNDSQNYDLTSSIAFSTQKKQNEDTNQRIILFGIGSAIICVIVCTYYFILKYSLIQKLTNLVRKPLKSDII